MLYLLLGDKMEKIRYADILDGIDESWSIKEKAKYIYNEICKKSSYDERFIYSGNPQLLESIYNTHVDVDTYISPKLICKTLNEIYSELLNRLGIRNKIIKKPSSINKYFKAEDVALIFFDEDNTPYFTAIAADIQRCKYGMKTQFFGGCDNNYPEGNRDVVCVIKADELEDIDLKINYLSKKGLYSDIIFDLIAKDVKQNNELKKFLLTSGLHIVKDYLREEGRLEGQTISDNKLKQIIQSLSYNDMIKIKIKLANIVPHNDKTSGPIENKKYSIQLLKNAILNKSDQRILDCFDMVKEDKDQVKILSILRFNLQPEPIYYLYSDDSQQYELLSSEDALKISYEYKAKNNRNLVEPYDGENR